MDDSPLQGALEAVAVVGMSGRFPKARNVAEFWENLRGGVEAATVFSDDELLSAGVEPTLLNDRDFVRVGAVLDDVEMFDASFFGFNHREAEVMDPQQRLFLECAWHALEDAGYDPETFAGLIGVYGGAALSTYLPQLEADRETAALVGAFQMVLGNDKDHLTTRVSYKLNLKGPSFTVQTACSTSLVAVCLACQSLQGRYCDMALAGGVGVKVPQSVGYLYEKGGILSPDGHCRPFDSRAQGIIPGNGVGVVVLKRLADALGDGDHIYAVIRGCAINNDGSAKVGYTAPSQSGQAEVIATAQAIAGVPPDTITYVEAHGTGTPLGDPIEIAALTQAFRWRTAKKGFCAVGSVKSNVGHLDTAAGVAGLIKTILSLNHGLLPPSINFREPNPEIDFANSPFYVNDRLAEWKTAGTPRRAGVSSFGIGGTNAHLVLEEAPPPPPEAASPRAAHLLLLSAKTKSALEAATANLAAHLKQHPDINLADLAYTTHVGRRAFEHRRMLLCRSAGEARGALEALDQRQVVTTHRVKNRSVVFMFPGQGSQHVNMALDLYRTETVFRTQVEQIAGHLGSSPVRDLKDVLYPPAGLEGAAEQRLRRTDMAQVALFTVEYALARLWMSWGVRPQAMIGHSIGEYVAACLAGVLTLEESLSLVAERGRLMRGMPEGAMLAVTLSEADVRPLLGENLSLAAVNGPSLCVVSGPPEEVRRLETKMASEGVECRRLHTSHAFHSAMMEPMLEEFTARARDVKVRPPSIPYLSNVTGRWITAEEVGDVNYWAAHVRRTVQFEAGAQRLLEQSDWVLLEVGPGHTLCNLLKWHADKRASQVVLASLPPPRSQESDATSLLGTLGRLWLSGVEVDWFGFHADERRRRLPLPPYPFERQRYWVNQSRDAGEKPGRATVSGKRPEIADWFYAPSWKKSVARNPSANGTPNQSRSRWLVFCDSLGVGHRLARRLEEKGGAVATVVAGEQFDAVSEQRYAINPRRREDYDALFTRLRAQDQWPEKIFHLWSVTATEQHTAESSLDAGFYSLLFMAQALGEADLTKPLQICVVSNGLHSVTGEETLLPEKATVLGPCRVIPQEYPLFQCRSIDLSVSEADGRAAERAVERLSEELTDAPFAPVVAYRGTERWVQFFEPVRLDEADAGLPAIREGGVYLLTGGLGGMGLVLARYLAQTARAKLSLVGRSAFPERPRWEEWLAHHDEQDKTSRAIKELQAIESLGGEVLVYSADVTDEEQMREVVNLTARRFGEIHGVIHAAGVAGGGIIQLKTRDAAERVLSPKVKGALTLDRVLKGFGLDFYVLCSSLNSVFGGYGQVDYCAANAFLDTFAHSRSSRERGLTLSLNWDAWREVGMAVETAVPPEMAASREEGLRNGILPEEGAKAFARALRSSLPQVLVSTLELEGRMRKNVPCAASDVPAQTEAPTLPRQKHPRPALDVPYAAAETGTQQVIADLWQELLGVEQVGIHDNFLDLGGHSLLAIQLVSRLRQAFQTDISVRTVFEEPTVAGLARAVEQATDKKAAQRPRITRVSREERRVRLSPQGTPETSKKGPSEPPPPDAGKNRRLSFEQGDGRGNSGNK